MYKNLTQNSTFVIIWVVVENFHCWNCSYCQNSLLLKLHCCWNLDKWLHYCNLLKPLSMFHFHWNYVWNPQFLMFKVHCWNSEPQSFIKYWCLKLIVETTTPMKLIKYQSSKFTIEITKPTKLHWISKLKTQVVKTTIMLPKDQIKPYFL